MRVHLRMYWPYSQGASPRSINKPENGDRPEICALMTHGMLRAIRGASVPEPVHEPRNRTAAWMQTDFSSPEKIRGKFPGALLISAYRMRIMYVWG